MRWSVTKAAQQVGEEEAVVMRSGANPKVFSVGTNNTPKYSFPACWNVVQCAKPTHLVRFPPCDGEFGSIVQRSEWRKNYSVQKAAAKITSAAWVCRSKSFPGKQIFTFQGKVRVEKAERCIDEERSHR